MLGPEIELELEKIDSITPQWIDDGGSAAINVRCTLTEEYIKNLEREVLRKLRERDLTDMGIMGLADYIRHIGWPEFGKQLAAMGYDTVYTKEKRELFDEVVRRYK